MSLLKKTPLFCAKECATFLDLLRMQYSKESQIAASLYFRKKLAACQEPPSELVEAIINELVDCIQRPSGELQLNASWALTNLACGSRQQTHRIIASGGVRALMKLAKTATGEARDQAIWALGNLAADCALCRESVRETGLIDMLIQLLELPDYQLHDSRKILIWCLANVLRGGINDLELENVGRLLNSLNSTISIFGQGGEILCDAIWCVAYLIDHQAVEGERIDMLLQQPALVANIVALLRSDSIRSLTGALRTVGNVITGTDEQTTAILDYGVLQDLSVLVNSGVHQISRECLWILSNIAAGTQDHITRLFSIDGLAESVMRLCSDQSLRKRKEAYWVMVNAMMGADSQMYEYLLGGGLAQILVQLLEENLDQALFDRTISTIWRSLQERPEHKNYTMALFRRVGLIEQILKVAQNTSNGNDRTAELASNLLHQHFGIHVIKRNAASSSLATISTNGGGNNRSKRKEKILVRIRKIHDC